MGKPIFRDIALLNTDEICRRTEAAGGYVACVAETPNGNNDIVVEFTIVNNNPSHTENPVVAAFSAQRDKIHPRLTRSIPFVQEILLNHILRTVGLSLK